MKPRTPKIPKLRRKYEIDESQWIVRYWRPKLTRVGHGMWSIVLFVQWGRLPKSWEISFIAKMRGIEERGLTFDEVLRATLPSLVGEAPTEILRAWIGRKAWRKPDQFAKTMAKMFGTSSKSILTGVSELVDPDGMLEMKRPREPPYQSLIEAIQRSDKYLSEVASYPSIAE